VRHASDVAKLLRENVVQGEKMDGQEQERYRELFSAAG
jgi:ABC-type siderophore export system fused ATPase/permease subunit